MSNNMEIDNMHTALANPYYAVNISPTIATPHQTMVTKEQFAEAFVVGATRSEHGEVLQAPEDIAAQIRKQILTLLDNLESDEIPFGYKEA